MKATPEAAVPPRRVGSVRGPERPGRARVLVQLYLGLLLFSLSTAIFVEGHLGVMPWDVLHQGLAARTGASLGQVTGVASLVVLMLWVPLRQRPGFGTLSNLVVLAATIDLFVSLVPRAPSLVVAVVYTVVAVVMNAFATALYVGARLGPGPRDGLMTGLVARTGLSVRLVRTSIEVVVVSIGWLLGGTLGVATVAYALLIGPLAQVFMPWFHLPERTRPRA